MRVSRVLKISRVVIMWCNAPFVELAASLVEVRQELVG
jgi:hypothetical protein